MNNAQFWQLIDRVHAAAPDDMGAKCEGLGQALRRLDDSDLRDFLAHFTAADARAYDWKLWAAAYVLRGGCSDFSAEERAILTAAVNGFKPKPFAWQELLREDDDRD